MFNRRSFLMGSGVLLLGAQASGVSAGMTAPGAPRLIFGFPAGAIGTEFAQGCSTILASHGGPHYQVVTIDSRNSRDATIEVKNAPPDGSVVLHAQSTSMVMLASVYRNLGFDPLHDFAPVAALAEMSLSLTVGPVVPANVTTLDQYLKWVEDNPDQREIGFSIYGSQGHLAALMTARAKGATLVPRPYKGTLMLLKDVAEGGVAAAFTTAANGNPEIWSTGKLRSLGVTSSERVAHWPHVPTLAEQGVPGMDLRAWFSWQVPIATPEPVLNNLREKTRLMTDSPEYNALLQRLLLKRIDLSPPQVIERTANEIALYKQLGEAYNIRQLD